MQFQTSAIGKVEANAAARVCGKCVKDSGKSVGTAQPPLLARSPRTRQLGLVEWYKTTE